MELLATLLRRPAGVLLEAHVGPPAPEQLRAADERRLPVEDDGVPLGADEPGRAGDGPRLRQLLLDAGPVQPDGEVADRLVVGEVGLVDPAGDLAAADPGDLPPGRV